MLLAGCGGRPGGRDGKPVIMVTIEPQRYFAQAIAGEKFDVVSMVPRGSSPETYDPVPRQLVELSESKAYLRIGYIGFEQTWMDRLLKSAPHLPVFDTSEGIDLIEEEGTHAHSPADTTIHAHAVEPHVWTSPVNALLIASNTCRALCQLDKGNEAYFLLRYDSLCRRIQRLDSVICRRLSTPGASKSFLVYHPTLTYFARDYGLRQVPIEEDGKEPSPAYLKQVIDLCRAERIRTIFVQPEFDTRNAETIARQTGTAVTPINPLSYDWEREMLRVADALLILPSSCDHLSK
ncbi:MAG: zinc ABC transporter substrate-binding protein [Mediterranea sp.]|jgi:zinc transport system substrate-binding protein|nr:zinc ABC transporter substrate-binding protein [Mediterranea sp.]